MFQVNIPQQCGCFRRSGKEASVSFDNKDDALMHATEIADMMNNEFCKKHNFNVVEDGNNLVILMGSAR